jgi:hypothetical protein
MSRALERYGKRQARKWVRILREKWGIESFSVGRDGSVKYGDLTFASFRLGQDVIRWEILSYPFQDLRTPLYPAIVPIKRHYLCIVEQIPKSSLQRVRPELKLARNSLSLPNEIMTLQNGRISLRPFSLGAQFFLTLALIHHVFGEKFGRSLQEITVTGPALKVVYLEGTGGALYGRCIEVKLDDWKRVGREGADYYLRFPVIDETTEPDDYTVYFVIDERGKTELLPIPYTQLLKLEPENFLQLAALTAL